MTGLTSTGAVFAAALVFVGVAVFEAWWVFEVVFGAGAALGVVAAPGPKGWCLMMCGVARDELELPPMNFRPPAARTANSRPQIAAIRTGGESVSVTSFLSATRSRDLKNEGRGLPRPSSRTMLPGDYGQEPLTMSAPGPALFQT